MKNTLDGINGRLDSTEKSVVNLKTTENCYIKTDK